MAEIQFCFVVDSESNVVSWPSKPRFVAEFNTFPEPTQFPLNLGPSAFSYQDPLHEKNHGLISDVCAVLRLGKGTHKK